MILYISPTDNVTFDVHNPGTYANMYMTWNKDSDRISLKTKQKFEHCLDSKITIMTANEYIKHCMNDIYHQGYVSVVVNKVNFNKVNKFATAMLNGNTFDLCYLNYVTCEQDGLHRAIAYERAFGEFAKFPVLEIFKANVTNDEIYEYAKQKSQKSKGNINDIFKTIALKHNRNEKEINKYLKQINADDTIIDEDDITNNNIGYPISDISSLSKLDEFSETFDYDKEIQSLCKNSNKTTAQLYDMNISQLNKLLDKYL